MARSSLDATAPLPSAELNRSSYGKPHWRCYAQEAAGDPASAGVSESNLSSWQLPALPQAGGESAGTQSLALQLSEVLIQPVGPLAQRADVQPQSICTIKTVKTQNLHKFY